MDMVVVWKVDVATDPVDGNCQTLRKRKVWIYTGANERVGVVGPW